MSAESLGRAAWGIAAALLVASCAVPLPPRPDSARLPGVTPERDLRASYRAALCRRLDEAACERVLLRVAGEASRPISASPADLPRRYRLALVPGLFAECIAPLLEPFGDVVPRLRDMGFDVTVPPVAGRGTVEANARVIAAALESAASDGRPLIVIAHSKGLPDVLEYLASGEASVSRVAAVISIAGAAHGSPLADAHQEAYRTWLARLPLPGCASSDGSEILDLAPGRRREWWREKGARVAPPIFSLVAMPGAGRISLGLETPHASLASIDANDGQLLWYDQMAPNGYLLGFVDADHWAVAMRRASLPLLGPLLADDVPRFELVQAAIEVVDGAISGTEARGRPPH